MSIRARTIVEAGLRETEEMLLDTGEGKEGGGGEGGREGESLT